MRRSIALALFAPSLVATLASCSPTHPCETTISKGPWAQRVDDSRATIRWESLAPGCVEAALSIESPSAPAKETIVKGAPTETHVVASWGVGQLPQPDLAGTYFKNEIALDGLQPNTCYRYRVRSTGKFSGDQVGRFCTARPTGSDVRWFAVGDTDPILGHTLDAFKLTLPPAGPAPDFVMHLGDIQYYSTGTETWAYWFGVMQPMLRAAAFFPTIGNHENENSGSEYDDYYSRLFLPASFDDGDQRWYHFESGGVYFFSLDTEEDLSAGSPQVQWIESNLMLAQRSPGFRFSVVFMHRPFYTLGDTDPQVDARLVLQPIFGATGVKLVVAGHMHGYERFETPDGLTWITCAGGGGAIGDVNMNVANYPADAPYRVAVSDHYHDCLFDVTAGQLSSTVIDEFGATIDQWSKPVP